MNHRFFWIVFQTTFVPFCVLGISIDLDKNQVIEYFNCCHSSLYNIIYFSYIISSNNPSKFHIISVLIQMLKWFLLSKFYCHKIQVMYYNFLICIGLKGIIYNTNCVYHFFQHQHSCFLVISTPSRSCVNWRKNFIFSERSTSIGISFCVSDSKYVSDVT